MKSMPLPFPLCLLACVGWLALILLDVCAGTYEVLGQLTTVIYKDGAVTHSRTNPFKASVDGCQFRVRMEATGLAILYSEFATVEDYSLELIKNDVALMKSARSVDEWGFERWPQPKPGWIPEANLYVNPTVVPAFSTATLPWLAYGSRCYLSEARKGMILSPVVQDLSKSRTSTGSHRKRPHSGASRHVIPACWNHWSFFAMEKRWACPRRTLAKPRIVFTKWCNGQTRPA